MRSLSLADASSKGFFWAALNAAHNSPAFFITSVTFPARLCSLMMVARFSFSQSMYALRLRFGASASFTFFAFRAFFSSFGDFWIAFCTFGLFIRVFFGVFAGDFFALFTGDFFADFGLGDLAFIGLFAGVFFGVPAIWKEGVCDESAP